MKSQALGIMAACAAGLVAIVTASSPAMAQRYTNYPVCAVYGGIRDSVTSCAFNNFAQCRASVSGRGGYCEANADYHPARKRVRRAY